MRIIIEEKAVKTFKDVKCLKIVNSSEKKENVSNKKVAAYSNLDQVALKSMRSIDKRR